MKNKATGKGRWFQWSRRVSDKAVTYRLFRRTHLGNWDGLKLEFLHTVPRTQRAEIINKARREFRAKTDDATLKAWGLA